MDRANLEKLLADKFPRKYVGQGLTMILDKIEKFPYVLMKEFDLYFMTGEEPETEVAGYSFKSLKQKHGMNDIAAFLTLDWLIRDPIKAIASLKEGH